MGRYTDARARSLADPSGFWLDAAAAVDWVVPPRAGLDDSQAPLYRWFPDAELNTCVNAVDRHVAAGRGDQPAVIHDSAITGEVQTLTYAQLLERVARFAGVLSGLRPEAELGQARQRPVERFRRNAARGCNNGDLIALFQRFRLPYL